MEPVNQHHAPAAEIVDEAPEGIWFTMSDGQNHVRCLVERSAWRARALHNGDMHNGDMVSAVVRNWAAITDLASRKLRLMEREPTELYLTADDLFNIAWRERRAP